MSFISKAGSEIVRDVKGLLLLLENGNKYFLLLFVAIVVIHILFRFAGGDWTIERALGRGEEGKRASLPVCICHLVTIVSKYSVYGWLRNTPKISPIAGLPNCPGK